MEWFKASPLIVFFIIMILYFIDIFEDDFKIKKNGR